MVLMDINLPGMSGIECSRHIKEKHPKVLIMMCTVYEDDEKIFSALKAGASGYILKRASIEEIFDSIKLLLAGGSPMSATIARKVVESFMEKNSAPLDGEQLSERENEILDQLAMGLRIKEIADKLNISINTVRTHIRHIYEKLQVQTRVEALNKARKSKFL
jgi:DNA-binding NarL/FixJ family response regulator